MKKNIYIWIGFSVLVIALGIMIRSYFNLLASFEVSEAVNTQQALAIKGEVEKYIVDSTEAYRKIAYVTDLNDDLEKENAALTTIIDNNDETIIGLTSTTIQLGELVDSMSNNVIVVSDDMVGKVINVSKKRDFYNISIGVFLGNPTIIRDTITFNPFNATFMLGKNTDDVYSGYLTFEPDYMNKYLTINNVVVKIDRESFYYSDKYKKSLYLSFGVGVVTLNEMYLLITSELNLWNKHYLEAGYGIGNSYLMFGYRYGFKLLTL